MKEVKRRVDPSKVPVGINLHHEAIDYFKKMSIETGIGYQQLINFYLMDCVKKKRKIKFED
jgi:uncharacterized protein (DUF4415 family)